MRGRGFRMSRGRAAVSAALVLVATAAPAAPGTRRDYGAEWRRLDLQNHILYVGGLEQGSAWMSRSLLAMAGDSAPRDSVERAAVRRLGLTPYQRRIVRDIADHRAAPLAIERFGTRAVSRVMSDLYADPANTFIPWLDIVTVSVMRLRGDSTRLVDERLRELRADAARRDSVAVP